MPWEPGWLADDLVSQALQLLFMTNTVEGLRRSEGGEWQEQNGYLGLLSR